MLDKLIYFIEVCWILLVMATYAHSAIGNQKLVMLIPNEYPQDDLYVKIWTDAAAEEGLLLDLMYDNEFIDAQTNKEQIVGVILPDQVHVRATDSLIAALDQYVMQGGNVMLTYDFGLKTEDGGYCTKSRFCPMVGVDYAVGGLKVGFGPIVGMADTMDRLQVPPGKTMDYMEILSITPAHRQNNRVINSKMTAFSSIPQAISTYQYGILNYYCQITTTDYTGFPLLVSPNSGLAAGLTNWGKGKVLFVNVPLGYFAAKTDGMLLHGFLHYFAIEMLQLPCLSSLPNARGGLILNWHLDAKLLQPSLLDIQKAIETLDSFGIWDRGKFSINITAGPDASSLGDGYGFNLSSNPVMQDWIRKFMKKGHAIGSHGGWIHDYFGLKADENNSSEFLKFLVWNSEAVKAVTQQEALEYSAPCGNNPHWAMDWLERQGVVGYYYAGDTGCPPHRAYRDKKMDNPKMWAFSVTPFGKYAVWEEFDTYDVPEMDVQNWYYKLIDFVVTNRTNRLIYMHPPFAKNHGSVLKRMFDRTDLYAKQGLYQWYTMAELGQFENSRLQTKWNYSYLGRKRYRFTAVHPTSLAKMTWLIPKSSYSTIYMIVKGKAEISEDHDFWIVAATGGKSLTFDVNGK